MVDLPVLLRDTRDMAITDVEGHLPVAFPLFWSPRVFLEDVGITLGANPSIQDGVISNSLTVDLRWCSGC